MATFDFEPFAAVYDHWGDRMPIMACEEMAELIQSISKFERQYLDDDFAMKEDFFRQHIIKEMADVYIACAALTHRYEITEADIGEAIWDKMDKKY